jgi:uncharacterized membrane protein
MRDFVQASASEAQLAELAPQVRSKHTKTALRNGSQPSVGRNKNRIHGKNPTTNLTISMSSPIMANILAYSGPTSRMTCPGKLAVWVL